MGTIYYMACDRCKVIRDIDKNYSLFQNPENREAMRTYAKYAVSQDSFRAGLIVSFLFKHQGHPCRLTSEYDESIFGLYDLHDNLISDPYTEERSFWHDPKEEKVNGEAV